MTIRQALALVYGMHGHQDATAGYDGYSESLLDSLCSTSDDHDTTPCTLVLDSTRAEIKVPAWEAEGDGATSITITWRG